MTHFPTLCFSVPAFRGLLWIAIALVTGLSLPTLTLAATPDYAIDTLAPSLSVQPDLNPAARPPKPFRNPLSLQDRSALTQNRAIQVIVEFDQAEVVAMAETRRSQAALPHDDAAILAERVSRYRQRKEQTLTTLAAESFTVVSDYSHLPMSVLRVQSLAALDALLQQPGVKAVYSDVQLKLMLNESLPLIRQPETAAQGGTGTGVTVAVLDTGVDYARAAFGNCATPGGACKVAFAQDFAPNDGALDDNGHGTNVAGTVLGVAPGARIAALDVFENDLASSTDIIAAINWAIANQAAYNIVALNLSLGGSRFSSPCASDVFATPLANAKAAGILAAVAAGNEAYKNALSSPACAPAAVSVGAVYDSAMGRMAWSNCTDAATQADQITCFSNSASFLTLLAPGSSITAAGITQSGTSQATPHVAGAIAVLRAAYPGESVDATIGRLTSTGQPITDTNGITKPRIDLLSAFSSNRTAYLLTVAKSGTGGGTVNSSPTGIACGTSCSANFADGTSVSLTAQPAAGSTFGGWGGACAGTGACQVTMAAAKSVTAIFNGASGEISLAEALDNAALNWRSGGDVGWRGVQFSDRDAAQSGVIDDGQWSELSAALTGPGTLTFQWRTSSEADYDYLLFYIDDVLQDWLSGETGWLSQTVNIGAGTHEIKWFYFKDDSFFEGSDAGWVDAVAFTPSQASLPDLTVVEATSPANGTPGGKIAVAATVVNQSAVATGASRLSFFLSSDSTITTSDLNTGWGCSLDPMAGGATVRCSGDIVIPATVSTGTYYLGAYADTVGSVAESNESNNGLAATNPLAIANSLLTLTLAKDGTGSGKVSSTPAGIDCGAICSANFAPGATVILTAQPVTDSVFSGWGGACVGTGSCTVSMNTAKSVTATFKLIQSQPAAKVGVFRNGQWFLDANGNGAWEGCGVEYCFSGFGQAGDVPASGNWDGGSKSYIGVLRSSTGQWFVDRNGNRQWDGCIADGCYSGFGQAGDLPVAGDWSGNGVAKIGVFRNGQWFLDANGNGAWDGCGTELCLSFGQSGDLPVAGNWNGGRQAGVGVFRAGTWYLDYNGNGAWDGCGIDHCYFSSFGQAGDLPAAGDWNGDGKAKVGVFRNGTWYLDYNGNGAWDGCSVDRCYFGSFGQAGDLPVAGKW
ncbi:S8 family serine peptidase [Candidatus Contendibacter odensensis]|uniref:Subtilisin n=1 Tax=Candidatus Contendobacter odensis Run_B_J11 TaxID=1400861 RepID=A0A7U7G964_9GAMM|nr:S8 family serine peptidase [Candidatus Contendobacter odensis]MBK8751036.1 S8 family serine peptidase [Candidatus Competibacteraceae bacterium]CDH44208.1 putative Subtilisin [Candidatus Contendobacter odensis Run_B_J11]